MARAQDGTAREALLPPGVTAAQLGALRVLADRLLADRDITAATQWLQGPRRKDWKRAARVLTGPPQPDQADPLWEWLRTTPPADVAGRVRLDALCWVLAEVARAQVRALQAQADAGQSEEERHEPDGAAPLGADRHPGRGVSGARRRDRGRSGHQSGRGPGRQGPPATARRLAGRAIRTGLGTVDPAEERLWGRISGRLARGGDDGTGEASWVWVSDATAPAKTVPEVRESVGIDWIHGVAARGLLFTREVLPIGTRFSFELRVDDPELAQQDGRRPRRSGWCTG